LTLKVKVEAAEKLLAHRHHLTVVLALLVKMQGERTFVAGFRVQSAGVMVVAGSW
jgi:hypothetical protein